VSIYSSVTNVLLFRTMYVLTEFPDFQV